MLRLYKSSTTMIYTPTTLIRVSQDCDPLQPCQGYVTLYGPMTCVLSS